MQLVLNWRKVSVVGSANCCFLLPVGKGLRVCLRALASVNFDRLSNWHLSDLARVKLLRVVLAHWKRSCKLHLGHPESLFLPGLLHLSVVAMEPDRLRHVVAALLTDHIWRRH